MKKLLVLLTALMLLAALALPALAETADAVEPAQTAQEETAETEPAVDEAAADAEAPAEEEEEPDTGINNASSLITIAILVVLMIIGLVFSAKHVKWNAAMIAKAAICIALAYVLGMIKLFRMPMGGSVTPASLLPLILFAMAFGPLEGLLVGCTYGLLDLLIDPYVIHPLQLLVDYPMAYAAVALCCVAKLFPVKDYFKLPIAVFFGYLGKYIMAVLSGVVFFAEYAGDQGALAYSLLYNLNYTGWELLICIAISLIPGMARLPGILRKNSAR